MGQLKAPAGPNRWLQLAALCTVPLIMVLGNSMLIPVLPDMGRVMNISKATTGLAVTAFSLSAGVAIAVAGFLADRYGRKLVVVPSLVLYGLGGIVSGLAGWRLGAGGFTMVMVGRVIQGIGAAGTAPVAMAFVGDLFRGGSRVTALGIFEASNGLGKVISPILGALIGQVFVWWAVFFAYALLAIPFALGVWFLTREPRRQKAPPAREYFRQVIGIFRQKGVPLVACFWAGTVALFVLFGVLFFLSEHLENAHGIDGVPKGVRIMWPVLAMSVVSFSSGLYLQNHKGLLKPAVIAGLIMAIGGTLLIAFIRVDGAFYTGLVIAGLGTGLQLPGLNNLITSSARSEQRAMITSIYGAVRFIGVAFGPPIYGALMRRSEAVPFWFSAGVLASSLAATLLLIRPEQLVEEEGEEEEAGGAETGGKRGGPGRTVEIPPWEPPADVPLGTRAPLH
ncbi:MFS transporter [Symbiobacterium terraclitae]|uniref:MFS transporter n=1 Tax=Symbiobacterium terraclitae TaxID=557451 RepID=UPI0035B510EE